MKRSEINRCIKEAAAFFAENGFALPPCANWTPLDWKQRGTEADELRSCKLGWDVTDFSAGKFATLGLTLFTLRNGPADGSGKVYAEKIMFVRESQVTPFHYHVRKTEDIINRGGKGTGRLAVELYNRAADGGLTDPRERELRWSAPEHGGGRDGGPGSRRVNHADAVSLSPVPCSGRAR